MAKSAAAGDRDSRSMEIFSADTVIVGAGASGLAAAVAASRQGSRVIVAEGNENPGKKLYATGNGRCNFSNLRCSSQCFNRPEDLFVESVFRRFGVEETLGFFQSEGMMVRLEDGGRYYPYSGQASAVVNTLRRAAENAGCRFLFSDRAEEISFCGASPNAVRVSAEDSAVGVAEDDADAAAAAGSVSQSGSEAGRFCVRLQSGKTLYGKNLIIACGGRAGLKTGSTGDGYGFARAFGHTLTPPRPALTAAESGAAFLAGLKGVRARGRVQLWERSAGKIAEERGEIQFTGTGISGICVFDLTRFMDELLPPAKKRKRRESGSSAEEPAKIRKEYTIVCDFVPEKDEEELYRILSKQIRTAGTKSSEENSRNLFRWRPRSLSDALAGIVNERLAAVIAGRAHEDLRRAVKMLKNFDVPVSHTRGWEEAQVTCGGVRREELEPATLQSRLRPGLYFCGEVIDVDGRCGGFNLQWAWSSGAAAGSAAAKKGRERC